MSFEFALPRWLIEASIRRPRATVALWTCATIAVAPLILLLDIDTSTDSVLDRSGPDWSFYKSSREQFGGDETVVIAIEGASRLSPDMLQINSDLSELLEGLDGVRRVDSLSTFPIIRANDEGDLELIPPLEGFGADPEGALGRLEYAIQKDRIIGKTLISESGMVSAVSLVLEADAESHHEKILERVYEVVEGTGAFVSGVPVFRVEANRQTQVEIVRFARATAAIVAVFLYWLFRTPKAVVYGLVPGIVGSISVLAAMAATDVPLSMATMILPSMLIALGSAYSMHVLMAASGTQGEASAGSSILKLAAPLMLSGLTTVIGLLSLAGIRIEAVWHVGVYGALGVLIITVCAMSLLPAMLILSPMANGARYREFSAEKLVEVISRRRVAILLASFGILFVCVGGLSRMHVETDPTTWFMDSHPIRQSYLEIRKRLSGISPMNVVVSVGPGKSVLEPSVLSAIDELSDYLEALPEVGKSISVADPLRQINGAFIAGDFQPLPKSQREAEQYMLLLEGVEVVSETISGDRESANVLLHVDDNGSAGILAVAAHAREWWSANGPKDSAARPTGIMFEFARAEDRIAWGQLSGLLGALFWISIVLLAILGRMRLALVALIPNALPLVVVFGMMGAFGIPIDAGTVLIGGLALGVAVDDTIHLLVSFVSRLEAGCSSRTALRDSLESVLPAIIASTAMISGGFGVFAFSTFSLTRNLGWLTSTIMIVCLVADVFLLGALLLSAEWGARESDFGGSRSGDRRSDGSSLN